MIFFGFSPNLGAQDLLETVHDAFTAPSPGDRLYEYADAYASISESLQPDEYQSTLEMVASGFQEKFYRGYSGYFSTVPRGRGSRQFEP
jgi:hypothetical protein